MTTTLRLYRRDDLDEVVHLWYHTWHYTFPFLRHPEPLEAWKTRLRDDIAKNETVWVAERDGQMVGFLALRERDGYLNLLFVDPQFHHQGIGTALMNKAKHLSPSGLSLETLQLNREARAFYERHGFHVVSLGRNARNGQPDVRYCWMSVQSEES